MISIFFSNKLIFYFYFTFITLLVTLPINSASELNNISIISFRGDYFFHALVFLPWMFFQPVCKMNKTVWFITGVLFACGSEGLQYLLPYRAWNINDLLANALGVLLGFIIFTLLKLFPQKT